MQGWGNGGCEGGGEHRVGMEEGNEKHLMAIGGKTNRMQVR